MLYFRWSLNDNCLWNELLRPAMPLPPSSDHYIFSTSHTRAWLCTGSVLSKVSMRNSLFVRLSHRYVMYRAQRKKWKATVIMVCKKRSPFFISIAAAGPPKGWVDSAQSFAVKRKLFAIREPCLALVLFKFTQKDRATAVANELRICPKPKKCNTTVGTLALKNAIGLEKIILYKGELNGSREP